MKTTIVHRPPRLQVSISPREAIEIEPVPLVEKQLVGASRRAVVFNCILALVAVAGMVVMMLSANQPERIGLGAALSVGAGLVLGIKVLRSRRARRRGLAHTRTEFLKNLKETESKLRKLGAEQRSEALVRHPKPESLTEMIRDPYRLWERRKTDEDFLIVRLGVGVGKLAHGLKIPPAHTPAHVSTRPQDQAEKQSQEHPDTDGAGSPSAQPESQSDAQWGTQPSNSVLPESAAVQSRSAAEKARETAPDSFRFRKQGRGGSSRTGMSTVVADPVLQAERARMLRRVSVVDQLPIAIPLQGSVSLVGDQELCAEMLRAIISTVAVFHSPEDLQIHLALPMADGKEPRWSVWLPHLLDERFGDGPVGRRHASFDEHSATELCTEIDRRAAEIKAQASTDSRYRIQPLDCPHLLIVTNMDSVHGARIATHLAGVVSYSAARITVLSTARTPQQAPARVDVQVLINPDRSFSTKLLSRGEIRSPHTQVQGYAERLLLGGNSGIMDPFPTVLAETIARTLAPRRLSPPAEHYATVPRLRSPAPIQPQPASLGIALNLLLGVDDLATYPLDEAWAPRRDSDFLVIPLGIGADDEPVLLDIKTAQRKGHGPHGIVVGAKGTGKSELLKTLVLSFAICHPPQQLNFMLIDAASAGTFRDFSALPHTAAVIDTLTHATTARKPQHRDIAYQRLYHSLAGEVERRKATNDTVPVLLILIDELPALEHHEPLSQIIRTIAEEGAQLNMHLLLSCTPEHYPQLSHLHPHMNYSIALGKFTVEESQALTGTDELIHTPDQPGAGVVHTPNNAPHIFSATTISEPYQPGAELSPEHTEAPVVTFPPIPIPFGLRNASESWLKRHHKTPVKQQVTPLRTLDVVLQRLKSAAPAARLLWTAPLPTSISSKDLPVESANPQEIPVGLIDDIRNHRHTPLVINLGHLAPHCAFLGGANTGKTTVLCTLITHTAQRKTPADITFTLLDMAGTELQELAANPTVSTLATRLEPAKIRNAITDTHADMLTRESLALEYQQSEWTHRVLVIDGFDIVHTDFPDLIAPITDIALRGPHLGIQLIITARDWDTLPKELQSLIGTIIEFALPDPRKSILAPPQATGHNAQPQRFNAACALSSQPVGRALTQQGLFAQIARSDATPPSLPAPQKPAHTSSEKPECAQNHSNTVGETAPTPSDAHLGWATLATNPSHLVMVAAHAPERTRWLNALITTIVQEKTPEEIMIGVFDLAQNLLGAIPDEFLGGYAGTLPGCRTLADGLDVELRRRAAAAPEESNPKIILIFHHAELLAGAENPLSILAQHLKNAALINVRVIITCGEEKLDTVCTTALYEQLKEQGIDHLLIHPTGNLAHTLGLALLSPQPEHAQWVSATGDAQLIQVPDMSSGKEKVRP
ncbi:MAG: FtsK/SpoIIIE domain-containing protein [Corynebacterium sp.]|uniref:FtsK/SpoIIIE domain-containing protein n=1 Tax=Corynebacterium sp. TaxID=1720 RepID=UPI0026DD9C08|nr:FtsK/SpoIIIE domain-containing protein [Corynebacterium sp.]MDO4761949.1 FtsK/SpoIIIE domain-containing protein [Corynebacterium sp.]